MGLTPRSRNISLRIATSVQPHRYGTAHTGALPAALPVAACPDGCRCTSCWNAGPSDSQYLKQQASGRQQHCRQLHQLLECWPQRLPVSVTASVWSSATLHSSGSCVPQPASLHGASRAFRTGKCDCQWRPAATERVQSMSNGTRVRRTERCVRLQRGARDPVECRAPATGHPS